MRRKQPLKCVDYLVRANIGYKPHVDCVIIGGYLSDSLMKHSKIGL